ENEDINIFDNIQNIEELQEIIYKQNKYIQQLQIRVRISTPDIVQSSTYNKLTEENKNLNLLVDTYKNELRKLSKTNQINQVTLQEYEKVIRIQQNHIEEKNKAYEQLSSK
ncbi:unnamed protein product, partial [Adineta steineri]